MLSSETGTDWSLLKGIVQSHLGSCHKFQPQPNTSSNFEQQDFLSDSIQNRRPTQVCSVGFSSRCIFKSCSRWFVDEKTSVSLEKERMWREKKKKKLINRILTHFMDSSLLGNETLLCSNLRVTGINESM